MTTELVERETIVNHPAVDKIRGMIDELGDKVQTYSLADAIREGSHVTTQAYNFGDDESACAMTAAALAVEARS